MTASHKTTVLVGAGYIKPCTQPREKPKKGGFPHISPFSAPPPPLYTLLMAGRKKKKSKMILSLSCLVTFKKKLTIFSFLTQQTRPSDLNFLLPTYSAILGTFLHRNYPTIDFSSLPPPKNTPAVCIPPLPAPFCSLCGISVL